MRTSFLCRPIWASPLIASLTMSLVTGPALAQANAQPAAPAPPAASAPAPGSSPAPLSQSLTGGAKGEYEAAKLLYGDGDYAGALVKFQRAYELSHDPRLLWNMAVCEKNLRHYAKVLSLVDRYQKEGASYLSDQDRQDATALHDAVKAFVSKLNVTVNEAGATITVDDEPAGTTPLTEPLFVNMGQRHVKISKPGFKDYDEQLPVAGATDVNLTVKLDRDVHEGKVSVVTAPIDGDISVDGKPVGKGRWEGSVPSGGHSLRVTAQGMHPYQTELLVRDNETRNLQVTLEVEQRPANADSGGSSALWIAGGALLVAGAAIGGFFLLKPSDNTQAASVAGTMSPGTVQMPLRRSR